MSSPLPPYPFTPNILCLLGRAGVGKTTVANYLAKRYGARTVSLAGPLKKVAMEVMGFTHEQLYGDQTIKEAVDPRYGFSPRYFLQRLGTEGLREHFGKDVHVRNLVRRIEAAIQSGLHDVRDVHVVDDTRFPDEAEYFGAPSSPVHGAVIKIICTDAPRPEVEHSSERAIDEVSDDVISATVVSSRAQGATHLCQQVEQALRNSIRLVRFRHLLGLHPCNLPHEHVDFF